MKRARLHASKKALQQRQQMQQQQQSVACDGFWCVSTPDGAPVLLRGDAELASVVHVANLEPGVTADDVKDALGASEATLGPLAGQARLTFASETEAAAALQRGPVVVPRSDALRGWDRWVAACQAKPDPVALAREVDEFMARFDAQAAQAAQRARVQQVDDDGFVLVTRKRGRRAAKDAAGDFGVKVRVLVRWS